MATSFDGPDTHGHASLVTNLGSRYNARHTSFLITWRQVFSEAGGQVPDRNVARMLRCSHIRVRPGDNRRMDLIVPGLNVANGLPLFCDATDVCPISGNGQARPGTSNADGTLLREAEDDNNRIYRDVITSGLAALYCLGAEVYGRYSPQVVELLPKLARESARGLHPRLRRSTPLFLLHRWSGILSIGLQRGVAHIVAHDNGPDLVRVGWEPAVHWADLATA